MAKREPLVDVTTSAGDRIVLWTREELGAFKKRENDFWDEVSVNNMHRPPFNIPGQVIANVGSQLDQAEREGRIQAFQSIIENAYGLAETAIPLSVSEGGQALLDIARRLGLPASAGALIMSLPEKLYGEPFAGVSKVAFRGAVEFLAFGSGLTPAALESARKSLGGIYGRASQITGHFERHSADIIAAQETGYHEFLLRMEQRIELKETALETKQNLFTQEASATLAKFESTHSGYIEQMKLKAPVEYWRSKATEHKKSAKELRNWLAGFFVFMIGSYAVGFVVLHREIAGFLLQFQGSAGALLVISAAFALAASLPLWIGRLLVKFYLSEHHLATDAKEREIMTQTYLALTADGAVDEKDRSLILAALFRSTPDGVVKDNTQPDTSPAALFSKLLDSR